MRASLGRPLLAGVTALFLAQGSEAQTAQQSPNIRVDLERQNIATQRALAEGKYLAAEQACYARFAVSDCLRQARTERRLATNELRRQELLLNDMDRQAKALAELNRIENKMSDQKNEALAPEINANEETR